MKLLCKDLHELKFDEVKELKILTQDDNNFKFYITLETLYKIFKKQYRKDINKFQINEDSVTMKIEY